MICPHRGKDNSRPPSLSREMVQIEAELFKGMPPPELKPFTTRQEKALERSEAEYASIEMGFLSSER